MNGGTFDGALLTMEQRQLRLFYKDILNLAAKSNAIVSGDYFDLTVYNLQKEHFSDRVHAFVRFSDDEKLLIISGFNTAVEDVRIEIPEEIAIKMGLDKEKVYIARDLLWKEVEVGFDENFGFTLKIKPYSCFIFKIK
jgi:hypothetical protein